MDESHRKMKIDHVDKLIEYMDEDEYVNDHNWIGKNMDECK